MPFENKFMRLIAAVNTRKDIIKLLKYFKDNNIDIPEQYLRTAMNKYSLLPNDNDTTN
jgi:hypothetical protein